MLSSFVTTIVIMYCYKMFFEKYSHTQPERDRNRVEAQIQENSKIFDNQMLIIKHQVFIFLHVINSKYLEKMRNTN